VGSIAKQSHFAPCRAAGAPPRIICAWLGLLDGPVQFQRGAS
jgi:hypothetical protein